MTQQRKTILVTGATGGIGQAVCRRLAASGADLVLAARNESRLAETCKLLSESNSVNCSWIGVDLANESSISDFAAEIAKRELALDGVVVMPPQISPTNDCLPSNEAWRAMFDGSFIGPLALLKAAIDQRRPGGRFKVVIISGISSAQVLGHYATSNVLRCAWLAEAKTLAFAFGDKGIHVNTLSLGGTLTPGYTENLKKRAATHGMSFEERLADETSNIPLRKYGTPDEVAVAVEGLLSAFSDHMTGLNIMCDGGFTRSY